MVCTDLSASSDGIVKCAEQLGGLGVKQAVLVHVIELDNPTASGVERDAVFTRQMEDLESAGIAVQVDSAVGYAPYEIERIAVEHDADLIVAGSHGKGLFNGVMSGSVSSDLVRIAERPVLLTAPVLDGDPQRTGDACGSMLANVLFPSDFSGASDHASRLLRQAASRGARAITLLHVVQQGTGSQSEFSADDARERLASLADHLRDAGTSDVRVQVRVGDPERIVANAASSGEYSLIVMGPHCGTDSDAVLDSVTDMTLQKTVVPVLLAPPGWRP